MFFQLTCVVLVCVAHLLYTCFATHHVPVMQTEHVQQFKVCYSRTQKFFTVPLDPQ